MTMTRAGTSKRLVAACVAGAVAIAGLVFAPSAGAVDDVDVTRVAGATRYGTAADIAAGELDAFDGATTAILATGENFPDALAASSLAGANAPSPIVLTTTEELSPEALAALDELGVTDVIIVGGVAAVSDEVADTLTSEGYDVDRVAGVDRYETAAEIADAAGSAAELDGLNTAIIATGTNFPDALAGGTVAYLGGFPLLLTNDTVPSSTEGALNSLDVEQVLILGGTAAVSTAVENELEDITGNDAVRLAGANRFGTAVQVAEFGIDEPLLDADQVLLASGSNFPDALAGGPLGGELSAPIILAGSLPPESEAFLDDHSDEITDLIVLGGTAAVDNATAADAEAAAENTDNDESAPPPPSANQSFSATPAVTSVLDLTKVDPERTFTFSGLSLVVPYDVELYGCTMPGLDAPIAAAGDRMPNRSGDSGGGQLTFLDVNGTFDLVPDGAGGVTTTGAAMIDAVNNVLVAPSSAKYDQFADSDGELTIRVTSATGDCAIPVLWEDAGLDDDVMNLTSGTRNTYNTPAERFAVGGATVWHEGEAPNASAYSGTVIYQDVDENYVVLEDGYRYNYGRAGDTYWYEGANVEGALQLADFENVISVGDHLDHDVQSTSAYSRTGGTMFQIDADRPGRSGGLTATAANYDADTSADDLRFQWQVPSPIAGVIDQYCVQAYRVISLSGGVSFSTEWCTAEKNTLTPTGATTTLTVLNHGLAAGSYRFAVLADSETNTEGVISQLTPAVTIGSASDTTRPTIVSASLPTDLGTQDVLTTGDIIRLEFDEPLHVDATLGELTLTDGDGDTVVVRCGAAVVAANDVTSATCTRGADSGGKTNQRLTVTLLEDGDDSNVGGDSVVDIPLTITATSADIKDAAGNVVDLGASTDVLIDK